MGSTPTRHLSYLVYTSDTVAPSEAYVPSRPVLVLDDDLLWADDLASPSPADGRTTRLNSQCPVVCVRLLSFDVVCWFVAVYYNLRVINSEARTKNKRWFVGGTLKLGLGSKPSWSCAVAFLVLVLRAVVVVLRALSRLGVVVLVLSSWCRGT